MDPRTGETLTKAKNRNRSFWVLNLGLEDYEFQVSLGYIVNLIQPTQAQKWQNLSSEAMYLINLETHSQSLGDCRTIL